MEAPQSQRRRVVTAQLNSQLDGEDFDSMVMQLLTPNSECGDVLRVSNDGALVDGLKANWQAGVAGALRDTADAQGGARAAPNDAGAYRVPAAERWSAPRCSASN